ncbi:MAG: sugar phosphate isomerase/epimerase family protein [bacterium]
MNIEARNIDGKNIHDIADDKFDVVRGKLGDAGVAVNCFGSAIANWGKSIEESFDASLAEAKRAIPRMLLLGTGLIRIMSFAVRKGHGPDDQMEAERFRRVRELVKMFSDAGLTCLHENCMNYGGMGPVYTLRLLDAVPGLKLVFDTGNPVFTDDYEKQPPYPKQSAWEFYSRVKERVAYVHIKDGRWDAKNGQMTHAFPGEGQGDVRRILKDLLARGYDGGISIEPHLSVVFHDESVKDEAGARRANYIEYGRRLEKMIADMRDER